MNPGADPTLSDRVAGELVSIIIPAYNAERFIAETLASARTQTHGNLEIIVVDDGSTDGTASIVEEIASVDRRVQLLRQPNGGVAAARNLGIERARGEFIAPLDADDIWHPQKIARQIAAMRAAGPKVGMVYTWSLRIDETRHILSRPSSVPDYSGNVYPFLVLYNFVGNGSTPLLRRSGVLEAGGYDQSLRARRGEGCEDQLLYLLLAERYEAALVPDFLVGYRMSASNMSNNTWQMSRGHDLVIEAVRERHPELPPRLFRWSNSLTRFFLSRQNMRRRRLGSAALFLALSLASDPAFLLEPPFRVAAAGLWRRMLRGGARAQSGGQRSKFPESSIAPESRASQKAPFSRRRLEFLMTLCEESSSDDAGSRELERTTGGTRMSDPATGRVPSGAGGISIAAASRTVESPRRGE